MLFLLPAAIPTLLMQRYTIHFEDKKMIVATQQLEHQTKIPFFYDSRILKNKYIKEEKFVQVVLSEILNATYKDNHIEWHLFNGSIILKQPKPRKTYVIKGRIADNLSGIPVPHVSISLLSKKTTIISNKKGNFTLFVTSKNFSDSLTILHPSYLTKKLPVKQLLGRDINNISLEAHERKKNDTSSEKKIIVLGNSAKNMSGTISLNNQRQQLSIYINCKGMDSARIATANFFLSSKGTTSAPFRIRLYKENKETGGPGKEFFHTPLIAEPNIADGWYTMDLRRYNIQCPEKGFFIGMQSLFPEDYKHYQGIGVRNFSNPGQYIGYSRDNNSTNNTWHFSPNKTWFQLNESNFNAMISADLIIE
jgi:hypothetical protein